MGRRAANGSRASGVTTQGEMVVAKDLPLKGPSGTISKPWMSRADQSLSRTKPKMYERADSGVK